MQINITGCLRYGSRCKLKLAIREQYWIVTKELGINLISRNPDDGYGSSLVDKEFLTLFSHGVININTKLSRTYGMA